MDEFASNFCAAGDVWTYRGWLTDKVPESLITGRHFFGAILIFDVETFTSHSIRSFGKASSARQNPGFGP